MSELPRGWASTTLGDIVTEVRNGISAKPDQENGIPILRISAIRPMRLDLEAIRHLPRDFQEADTYRLVEGDLLFTRYSGSREFVGVCARVGLIAKNTVYPDKLIRVRVDRAVANAAFVERAVHAAEARTFIAGKLKTSAGQVGISGADLKNLPVPLAPLPEQKRIADKLDALLARVDACRERLDRVPGILKRFRQSVLAAATSGELTREWREERGLTPTGWTRSTVGQLIDGIEAGLNVQCEERPPTDSERGLVKISAVTWGAYDDNESKTLPKSADVPERSRIRIGDFLISRANTLELVGACVIVHRVTRPVFLSDKVLRLVMPEEWKPWMLLVLQSPSGRRDIEERASGNQLSMRNLSQANLRDIGVPVPSPEERTEIVRRVTSLFAFASELERRCGTERSMREKLIPSVLAKAFRGELVPQDPKDEPASELLARLRARPASAGTTGKPKRGAKSTPRR